MQALPAKESALAGNTTLRIPSDGRYRSLQSMTRTSPRPTLAALLTACSLFTMSCSSVTERDFTVMTFPEGATVFVDNAEQGVVDRKGKLVRVTFQKGQYARIRVSKEGFQPAGVVVGPESPGLVDFVLQQAPDQQKQIQVLMDVRSSLNLISEQLRKATPGK